MDLANCHAIGLDSIVIAERTSATCGMKRIFIARPEHDLYRNAPDYRGTMSIGMHAHHCDITMVPLFGEVTNVFEGRNDGTFASKYLDRYHFQSKIGGLSGTFRYTSQSEVKHLYRKRLSGPMTLPAAMLHSVYVQRGETAAWLILEGAENALHDPITWSDDDLTLFDAGSMGLYQPMSAERKGDNFRLLQRNDVVL